MLPSGGPALPRGKAGRASASAGTVGGARAERTSCLVCFILLYGDEKERGNYIKFKPCDCTTEKVLRAEATVCVILAKCSLLSGRSSLKFLLAALKSNE